MKKQKFFSMGVTLYQALTGNYPYGEIEPFQNPNFGTAKRAKALNKNIPSWLDTLILRAISVKEDSRYSNYSHLKFELEHPEKVKPFSMKTLHSLKKSYAKLKDWVYYIIYN